MNKFKHHIPNYVDGTRPDWIEFETTDDLLRLDVVQKYIKMQKNFSHFAISDGLLMAVYDEGYNWWCVGYIEKPDEIELPKWVIKEGR